MELPEELLTLILSKLPAKSLLRFKCVQKSWHSLINSPYFINLHSKKKNDCFLVRRLFPGTPLLEQYVLSLHSYETLEDLGNQINIPFSFDGGVDLCGSCAGLVCLSDCYDKILICNPTTREFRSLFIPPSFRKGSAYNIDSVAFGSDPNTGKYTVLMIGGPISDDGFPEGDREARLYDFSTDTWRETAVVIPDSFDYIHLAISLNGAFYWCPLDGFDTKNILTFNMSNEVSELIPLPDFAEETHDKALCVSSQSQLALILYNCEGQFEICVMTEYGVNKSWTRLFNIGPLPLKFLKPIAFWDEQRMLLNNAHGQLVSCDLQHPQNQLCHFPIHGGFEVCQFSQSLVSVNGIGKESAFCF